MGGASMGSRTKKRLPSKPDADIWWSVMNNATTSTENPAAPAAVAGNGGIAALLQQYGCGPIPFTGTDHGLYERHLLFDNVVAIKDAGPHARFEDIRLAARDVLS